MASERNHISIPADLGALLRQHPGVNKSKVSQKALYAHVTNPKVCSCRNCRKRRGEARR